MQAILYKMPKNNFSEREQKFYDEVNTYPYEKAMLTEFFEYWSEPNRSRTKMKWELEKTWDLKKRLKRWQLNNDRWHPKEKIVQKPAVKVVLNEFLSRPQQISEKRDLTDTEIEDWIKEWKGKDNNPLHIPIIFFEYLDKKKLLVLTKEQQKEYHRAAIEKLNGEEIDENKLRIIRRQLAVFDYLKK